MKVSLASALLRRKELQQKVDQLRPIQVQNLYEIKVKRTNVTENIDDVVAQVPIVKFEQVTSAYDWHARRLREVDLAIQQANHATVIEIADRIMDDYKDQSDLKRK